MKREVRIAGSLHDICTAEIVGPFGVHRMTGLGLYKNARTPKWGVTHLMTGYSAAFGPTKACCMHAARQLKGAADWSFTDPSSVQLFTKSQMDVIRVIRSACAQGGEA